LAFSRVARLDQVPEHRGLCVEIGDIEVGLFRVGDSIHAMENLCPHAGFPLSEGVLDGCVVVCAAHGWDFDVTTGFKPSDPDGFPIACFAVRIEGEDIWVDIETQINRPPPRRR
jgi:nitrite reductase/ring-hydroxylating ferredoxin subunit